MDTTPSTVKPVQDIILTTQHHTQSGTFSVPAIDSDQISIVLSGSNFMERRLEGRLEKGIIHPKHVSIVPRGMASTWAPQVTHASKSIHFMILPTAWQRLSAALGLELESNRLRDEFAAPDDLLLHIGIALLDEAENETEGTLLYRESLHQTLMMHLLHRYALKAPSTAAGQGRNREEIRFQRVIDYLEANLSKKISLDELAAVEGLSPYHFSRCFRAYTGQSPHQFVISLRVKRAQTLIDAKLPLSQVALQAGFASQSHLTRHFKRLTGLTPGAYRRLS
ncbi:MAG: AraC family transcriptional regulator [Chloroflexota bacterium]